MNRAKLLKKIFSWCSLMLIGFSAVKVIGAQDHALSFRSKVKYQKGFPHFEWANPRAPKGGSLRFGAVTAFDTLNPFTLKGVAANGADLVFETLVNASWDEPFTKYGNLAETLVLAKDRLSVTMGLHKSAKFSDGKPVTAQDVIFSFNLLMTDEVRPFYKSYYADVKKVVALNKHTVKFVFKKTNPELHLIVGEISILPKHIYGKGKFSSDFNKIAVGSGPYIVDTFEMGKFIRYKRNPNYWGQNINVNKGKFNFDRVEFKVFRDVNIWMEGLKAGDFDFGQFVSSKQWAVDAKGKKWKNKYMVKSLLPNSSTQGMQCFYMNQRNPLFKSRKLRKALAIAFDFDWSNKTLFYNQYTQMSSYWNNSELGAKGLPSKAELALLNPWKNKIPAEVFSEVPTGLGKGMSTRERLRVAHQLLKEDGWKLNKGTKVLEKNGKALAFEIALASLSWERITEPYKNNLAKIGVKANFRVYDHSQFLAKKKGHQFDMAIGGFGQSESPGNEQVEFWHSSKADDEGGRNVLGLKSEVIDALVEVVVHAKSRQELITATRALDRVLWFNYYVVPHWYLAASRVSYWNRYSLPKKLPKYFNGQSYFLYYGWYDENKDAKLIKAQKAGAPVR